LDTTLKPPRTNLKPPINTVDLAMDLLLSRPPNTGENQPKNNLKQRIKHQRHQ